MGCGSSLGLLGAVHSIDICRGAPDMNTNFSAMPKSAPLLPAKGPTPGLRLGVLTAVVVRGAMAVISGSQLECDLRAELRDRQRRLGESLAPLVTALQMAPTRQAAATAIDRFHAAHMGPGNFHHQLAVVDASGQAGPSSTLGQPENPTERGHRRQRCPSLRRSWDLRPPLWS